MDDAAKRHEAHLQFLTWDRTEADIKCEAHQERKHLLAETAGATFADTAYIAADARIFTTSLHVGEQSWIAGHCIVRDDVTFGAHCTVNPYAAISGKVSIGDGVRIATHVSIIGFNHGFDDPILPVYKQENTIRGITINDDVWIGANAVILDGVTIGKGAIIAAGAVVSKDVPELTIMAGVPAKPVRKRGEKTHTTANKDTIISTLDTIGTKAKDQLQTILAGYHTPEGYLSDEADGTHRKSIRHLCDAIEIAAGFDTLPSGLNVTETIKHLQSIQDPITGLFPDPFQPPKPDTPIRENGLALYNVLAVGYALETLGAHPNHPITAVELDAPTLCNWLESLPWKTRAWGGGGATDAIGTALYFNARYFKTGRTREALFGWLALNVDRTTGLWGSPTAEQGLLQPVNGFYRLTRGTYAQFGLNIPHADRAIDSVLTNYKNYTGFEGPTYTACNLLDTVHPLWLALKQTDHRRGEAEAIAGELILKAPARWRDDKGFPFADGQNPSLQGTEMWLSIIYLAAKILGHENAYAFAPRGVHRTEAVGLGL